MVYQQWAKKAFFIASLLTVGFFLPIASFQFFANLVFEHRQQNSERALENFADESAQRLRSVSENRRFWCQQLNDAFAKAENHQQLINSFETMVSDHHQNLFWLVWNDVGELVANNTGREESAETWKSLLEILAKASKTWWQVLSDSEDTFLRKILGRHFESKTFQRVTFRMNADLHDLSFFQDRGCVWGDFGQKFSALIFFPPGLASKNHGLNDFVKSSAAKGFQFALLKDDFFFSNYEKFNKASLQKWRTFFQTRAPTIWRNKNHFLTGRYLHDNLFFCASSHQQSDLSPVVLTRLFSLILVFFWLIMFRHLNDGSQRKDFSVRAVVIGLITCANIFPLTILGLLSHQYLVQKRQILIEKQRIEAVNFLRKLEGEFTADTHRIRNFAIKNIENLEKILQKESLNEENTRSFRTAMGRVAGKFMIVASTTLPAVSDVAFLGKEEAYLLNKSGTRLGDFPYSKDNRLQLNQIMSKCASVFISFYNDAPISDKVLTEAEITIESIFQDSINATFFKFLRLLDQVEYLGMGTERHPTFMHCLSFNPQKLADYLFMFHFNLSVHAQNFLTSKNSLLQGNDYGIKIVYAAGKDQKNLVIRPFTENQKFRSIFANLTTVPQTSAKFVNLNQQTWLATGFISKIIADISLVALSPISEIDRKLSCESRYLAGVVCINILLVIGISLIFSQTLLVPVALLQEATDAIRKRDFSHRIAALGKGEFGQMAQIFNTALRDLEEMSVARAVQQRLFPAQQVETGVYDLFCRSITMDDLGGDYLDVLPLDDKKFIMLMGDVAGHGVGAAIIMAMAKAAMINSAELLDRPVDLLKRLHDLIYRTKSRKQRKIMTFQYVMVDTSQHKIVYANAGGCNPYVVKNSGKEVQEIILPGPALGAFKNSRFNQIDISLEQTDTLVLYTDGLIESRNDSGEELGFERFADMLAQRVIPGSRASFDAIMEANRHWRQNQPRQDDFSLLILQRR